MLEERAYWLAWSQVSGVGPILLRRLQVHFGQLADAWVASAAGLAAVEGFGTQTVELVIAERSRLDPERLFAEHTRKNPCFWTPADQEYPRLLLETPSPPPVLYYRGRVELLENQAITPTVAIVGTRQPSEYGLRWTRRLSIAIAKRGYTIVSGLAAGIDAEAHRACLEVGGRTIGVFGTGVDVVYPHTNRLLYERLIQQGLALSEYPAGTGPNRSHFPRRNRIIAGLSRAVLVIEAPIKSGALITAYLANDFCRDVYALPGSLDNPKALGCLTLLSKGAQVILSEEHLLEMLGEAPGLAHPVAAATVESVPVPPLEPELAKVLQAVKTEPLSLDLIVQAVGLTAATVSSALLQLELLGLVSQLPGMRYQRC